MKPLKLPYYIHHINIFYNNIFNIRYIEYVTVLDWPDFNRLNCPIIF